MRRTKVYVAGPITTSGNVFDNVHRGILAGDRLLRAGYAPYVPHLNCAWETVTGARDYELWLRLDMDFLDVCDVLLRLPGDSRGADREVARAIERGIPVFYGIDLLVEAVPVEFPPLASGDAVVRLDGPKVTITRPVYMSPYYMGRKVGEAA